jgi:hypothetical protein
LNLRRYSRQKNQHLRTKTEKKTIDCYLKISFLLEQVANYTFKVLRFLFEFGEPSFNNADEVTSAKYVLCSAMPLTRLPQWSV